VSSRSDCGGSTMMIKEAVNVAAAAETKKVAEAVTAAKKAIEGKVVELAMAVEMAEEAAAVTGLDGSNSDGPSVVQIDASRDPDGMLDPKVVGKRPAAMIGSCGSSPPQALT
jgi:hypothetical protein